MMGTTDLIFRQKLAVGHDIRHCVSQQDFPYESIGEKLTIKKVNLGFNES